MAAYFESAFHGRVAAGVGQSVLTYEITTEELPWTELRRFLAEPGLRAAIQSFRSDALPCWRGSRCLGGQ